MKSFIPPLSLCPLVFCVPVDVARNQCFSTRKEDQMHDQGELAVAMSVQCLETLFSSGWCNANEDWPNARSPFWRSICCLTLGTTSTLLSTLYRMKVFSQGLVQSQILDLDLDDQDQKIGAIAGGIGAVVIVAVVAMFLVYYRKGRRTTKNEDNTSPETENLGRPQTKELWERSSPHTKSNQMYYPRIDAKLDVQNLPPYTDLSLHSPEAIYRQPQEDEVQAKHHILDEYRRQRAIQLEKQQELDRQIERELAEVQMLKDKQNGSPRSEGKRVHAVHSTGAQDPRENSSTIGHFLGQAWNTLDPSRGTYKPLKSVSHIN